MSYRPRHNSERKDSRSKSRIDERVFELLSGEPTSTLDEL